MPEMQYVEWKEKWKDDYLKWICGFANAQGGTIHIGKNDDGEIVGIENAKKLLEDLPNKIKNAIGIVAQVNLHESNGKQYIVINVEPYPFPVSCYGKYYFRSGSTNQLLTGAALDSFMLGKQGVTWDSVPVPYVTYADLSENAMQRFIKNAIKKGRLDDSIENETFDSLIDKLNLYKNGYLTNAAILLFHDDPEKYVFGSYIKIGFFETDAEIIYQDEIHGPLMEQIDKAIGMIYDKYLRAKISYEGIQRIEKYPFPYEAVREALLNAVVHKDYRLGIPIQISVYDDKMYIANDGKLPDNWTMEVFLGKHRSNPFNPLIAHVFYLAGYIESWGRGIEKIFDACKSDGICEPEYTIRPKEIMVKFSAPEERVIRTGKNALSSGDKTGDKKGDKKGDIKNLSEYSPNEIALIRLIISDGNMTTIEMAEHLHISRKSVSAIIKKLKDLGVVYRLGSKRKGEWKINSDILM